MLILKATYLVAVAMTVGWYAAGAVQRWQAAAAGAAGYDYSAVGSEEYNMYIYIYM